VVPPEIFICSETVQKRRKPIGGLKAGALQGQFLLSLTAETIKNWKFSPLCYKSKKKGPDRMRRQMGCRKLVKEIEMEPRKVFSSFFSSALPLWGAKAPKSILQCIYWAVFLGSKCPNTTDGKGFHSSLSWLCTVAGIYWQTNQVVLKFGMIYAGKGLYEPLICDQYFLGLGRDLVTFYTRPLAYAWCRHCC